MATNVEQLARHLADSGIIRPEKLQSLQRFKDAQTLIHELIRTGILTRYQAEAVAKGLTKKLVIGNYLILDKIGSGGKGQVYKARHLKLERLVALKALRPELLKDDETVQRFYREIEVVSQLSHPHIVHAYEAGPIGDTLILVMEHVEGQDLERLVQQAGPLPLSQACDFIRQTANGLQYAHERGLIHRDIKPSNLLLGDGKIKILDLGLARLQEPARGSTTKNLTVLSASTTMQGSPDYMAPEQAISFHSADIRSDIYSLGCTFFFLLTGRPLYPGGNLAEKLMKHQQREPPLDQLPDVPAPLVALLGKMLAKRPADRPRIPAEVEEALRPFGGANPSPGAITRPPLLSQKRWLALAIVLACGLAAWSVWPGPDVPAGPEPAVPARSEPAFLEADGMVVIEAEHFTQAVAGSGAAEKHAWTKTTKLPQFSGPAAIMAEPNSGVNVNLTTAGPRVDFPIRFTQPGSYYVWVRMIGATGTDDSVHVGLDGQPVTLHNYGLSGGGLRWSWVDRIGRQRVTVKVDVAGLHTLSVWMREDGVAVDKLLLTLTANYKPTDAGPEESPYLE